MRPWILPATMSGMAIAAVALVAQTTACGGGYDSPAAPTPPPGGGGPAPSTMTITVSGAGANASSSDVAVGGTVTVTNSDTVAHEMSSDPHPVHTNCPALNFGSLAPGESKTSPALTAARSCGVHDHLNPGSQTLMRTIVIR